MIQNFVQQFLSRPGINKWYKVYDSNRNMIHSWFFSDFRHIDTLQQAVNSPCKDVSKQSDIYSCIIFIKQWKPIFIFRLYKHKNKCWYSLQTHVKQPKQQRDEFFWSHFAQDSPNTHTSLWLNSSQQSIGGWGLWPSGKAISPCLHIS